MASIWKGNGHSRYAIFFGIAFSFFFVLPMFAAENTDIDNDGLSNSDEFFYYTDPLNADTDGDGFLDGLEVMQGFSPHQGDGIQMHQHDYDADGLNDWLESWFRSNIGAADSDEDGATDFDEVMSGDDPVSRDNTRTFDQKIVVDLTLQQLYYYVDTVKIVSYPVSTGNPQTPTPPGTYSILNKVETKRYVGRDYDLPNVYWNMQFKRGYYIHGAYWHNDFGVKTHSHGCVNMRTEDAKVLYTYLDAGVTVEIIGKTPKGRYVGT